MDPYYLVVSAKFSENLISCFTMIIDTSFDMSKEQKHLINKDTQHCTNTIMQINEK